MRCVYCTLVVNLLVGCQSRTMPTSNPFLSPDRVPPPATRPLLPGTAQPYYPGDPTPTLQPGAVVPPTYAPGTAYPQTAPVVPTNPPGGWNPQPPSYPAQPAPTTPTPYKVNPANAEFPVGRVAAVNEPPVRIQSDNQNLRFSPSTIQSLASDEPWQSVPQNQSVVQAQFIDAQTAPQPLQQTASVPTIDVVPQEVSIRAISSPGSESLNNSSGFRSPSRDGFRPQGSRRRASAGRANAAVKRFGFDPQYRWLRGQLEYDPTSQQWQLRYLANEGQADQYGGRLHIANPIVLGNLQPGDHVQLQGRLDSRQSGPTTVVPVYTVSAVQRQR